MIHLANAGVPSYASDIVVFAKVYSGYTANTGTNSFLNVYLKDAKGIRQDERQLFYITYPQYAISFNSENMVFPLKSNSTSIQAVLTGTFPSSNFAATIKFYGYYTTFCPHIG